MAELADDPETVDDGAGTVDIEELGMADSEAELAGISADEEAAVEATEDGLSIIEDEEGCCEDADEVAILEDSLAAAED